MKIGKIKSKAIVKISVMPEETFEEQFPSLKGKQIYAPSDKYIKKSFGKVPEGTLPAFYRKTIQQHCLDKQNIHKLPDDGDYLISVPGATDEQLYGMVHATESRTRKYTLFFSKKKISEIKELLDKEKVREAFKKLKEAEWSPIMEKTPFDDFEKELGL